MDKPKVERRRKRRTLADLPPDLIEQINRLSEVEMSLDQYRVTTRWLKKFIDGAVEHGKLDLGPSVEHLSKVLGLTTEEVQDLTSYVEMLSIQIEDLISLVQGDLTDSQGEE